MKKIVVSVLGLLPLVVAAANLVEYKGVIGEESGWKRLSGEEGKVVYIPFEGYYESKGGRIESPRFKLDKDPDENAWYELAFEAKSRVDGYWWVDAFDVNGNVLPDMNSRLYASDEWRAYRVMVSMQCAAVEAQVAFVTKEGVVVRDVALRRVSEKEAADWCRRLYGTLPQEDLGIPADAWAKLPRSQRLLAAGKPIRILLLGDSIVNDTWCGNVSALVCERYPAAKLMLSVRGSTGCWYYRDPKHFEEYVLRHSPDLVLVGGISNGKGDADFTTAEADMTEVIRLAQKSGIEVGVMSPPPSYEFRKSPADMTWDENFTYERYESWAKKVLHWQPIRRDYQRAAVARTGVAYFDLTTAPCDAIARSGKPLNWFKRDVVHNDDHGKQLVAQRLAAYFFAATATRDGSHVLHASETHGTMTKIATLPEACRAVGTVANEAPSLLPRGKDFRLVWHDEFNGTRLDETKWGYRTNFWGRRFPAYAGPEDGCVEVKDGKVHLKLKRRADGGFCSPQLQTGELLWDYPWDESRTGFWPLKKREKPKFVHRYGYYEARFRLQRRPGWWSAFWMQTETQGTCLDPARAGIEHDIMESFSPGCVGRHMFHMNGYGPDYQGFCSPRPVEGQTYTLDVPTDDFHTFGLLWESDGYTVFVDGRQDGEKVGRGPGEAVSAVPEFVLLSTECQWYRNNRMTGRAVDELESSAAAGDDFVVDFVRVYDVVGE